MSGIIRRLAAWGISPLFAAAFVLGVLIVAVVVLLNTCAPRSDVRRVEANTRILVNDGTAKEAAAEERLTDTTTINYREKERANATATLPNTRPSDRRVRRGCVILRQQGAREADLPVACRSAR
ncbi:hypothetical protein EGY25_03910 [Brevundimonas intermedia]|uniref:Uncharacterized protein n=1 Tax=Brevundimonas intermedia TaxID=74315 RepID=A0A4Y9S1H9_9CAUL|nr:hypothetical protein [Brevundimonas intermedia]TFW14351.1 hypothetical protein EGY25_03910 [Brevundimonas intermedia]